MLQMFRKRIMCFILAAVLAAGVLVGPVVLAVDAGEDIHVVQDGDVLWRIARDHGVTWEALAEYNALTNPHMIFPGQVLRIPQVIYIDPGTTDRNVADELYVGQLHGEPYVTPLPEIHVAPFITEDVTVGAGTIWPLGGYLTIPHTASADAPVPAVVLVHGSGPGDRNQTVFANRPFYDIAAYLSANGVAVLRYDKRTFAHGYEAMQTFGSSLTVWEETIEDAIFAADLLRADARIGDVFIAGLSLGGMLAPRIHASGGDFDGIIILAGSPRHLTDIMIDQNWLSLEGSMWMVEALEQQIDALQDLVGNIDTNSFDPDTTIEDIEAYADVIRAGLGLPETVSDSEAMWYMLDMLIADDWADAWAHFYENGNTEILRNMLGVGPNVDSHELSAITIINVAAGEPVAALAFMLDYIVAAIRAELTIMYYQLAEINAAPAQIEALEEFFASIPYMTTEEAKATEIAPGTYMFAYYFRDLMLNPTPYFLQEITVPMLIMHGDNDLQVYTEADFNLYRQLLAGRDNVTFRLFDGLNHLFMPSSATTLDEMLAEYQIPSQVDAQVLSDLLAWILAR